MFDDFRPRTAERYYLDWRSTVAERYNSQMNPAADILVVDSGLDVHDIYGGSAGTYAENGYAIDAYTIEPVLDLAQAIATAVGHQVSVSVLANGGTPITSFEPVTKEA